MNNIRLKLKKLRHFSDNIAEMRKRAKELEYLYRSPSYQKEVRIKANHNITENITINAIDELNQIYNDMLQLYDERNQLVSLIDSLSEPLQQVILRFYYVNGYSWEEVARELKLHVKTVQKQRAKAVKELESM